MVMQTAFLFPGTVSENVRFGPAQRGDVLSDAAVEELLARVGLENFAAREVHNLSGGQAQRVAVARALANHPSVLLLDEPTSALDEASKLGVEALIRSIVEREHLTCVMVTHDLQQAARLASRVVVLAAGAIVRVGFTQEVLGAERQL
jgi:putative ABC transport system ATP-binding protein